MGTTKKQIVFSKKAQAEMELLNKAFKKVAKNIIAETKAKNSYMVIAGKNGSIKKIPAKDL